MKLTTDSIKYHSEVERLLSSEYEIGWTPLWSYCEMTSMIIEGDSFIFLIKDGFAKRKFIYRKWIHSEQNQRNDLGFFDLDDIKISEEELFISFNDLFEIQNILNSDLKIKSSEVIILDGVNYKLTDFKTGRAYIWKSDEEIDSNMKRFVEIIKKRKADSEKGL